MFYWEEPYSLAMMLDKIRALDRVEIIATDIDRHVLNKAKSAYTMKKI